MAGCDPCPNLPGAFLGGKDRHDGQKPKAGRLAGLGLDAVRVENALSKQLVAPADAQHRHAGGRETDDPRIEPSGAQKTAGRPRWTCCRG